MIFSKKHLEKVRTCQNTWLVFWKKKHQCYQLSLKSLKSGLFLNSFCITFSTAENQTQNVVRSCWKIEQKKKQVAQLQSFVPEKKETKDLKSFGFCTILRKKNTHLSPSILYQ